VDGGFWYRIPESLRSQATVGRIVRVPLGGRRVRGWIVETVEEHPGKLKDLAGISGEESVFGSELLHTLEWAANHYVAPLSVLLSKVTPPNLPGKIELAGRMPVGGSETGHPLGEMARWAASGRRRPAQAIVGVWQRLDWIDVLIPLMAAGRSALIVAASAAEVELIVEAARPTYGGSLVSVAGEDDASITAAWEAAQRPGCLVVGTPRTATWQIGDLELVVVLEEGRRAMKERQTPTLHVRDVIRRRSLMEGFSTVFFGPTPSVEVLAAGAEVSRVGNRAWPLIEIVDRSQEPPGSGLISETVRAALRAVSGRGDRCFVFTFRKMVEQTVQEINAKLGAPAAAEHPHERLITVGTERDLAGIENLGLTVAANVDGMLMVPGYRSGEETLRQLARLANALAPGSRHRMMAQVMDPTSMIVETLRRGDPIPYLERVLAERARAGLPPSTEMLAIEIRDRVPGDADATVRGLSGVEIMGPLALENGKRWLVEGRLTTARSELREIVARWRESGATVRIDADPIDL
jgi:primosomal protein N'